MFCAVHSGATWVASVAEAAQRATEGVTVLEDLYGSVEYKSHLATVMVKRAVLGAIANS